MNELKQRLNEAFLVCENCHFIHYQFSPMCVFFEEFLPKGFNFFCPVLAVHAICLIHACKI